MLGQGHGVRYVAPPESKREITALQMIGSLARYVGHSLSGIGAVLW